jgi:hypothetical protein
MHRPFNGSRDDGPFPGIHGGVIDDAMAQQRPVLHQPKHSLPPLTARPCEGEPRPRDRALNRMRRSGVAVETPKINLMLRERKLPSGPQRPHLYC